MGQTREVQETEPLTQVQRWQESEGEKVPP